MLSVKQVENLTGLILLMGTILSGLLVLIGGILFLYQHGHLTLRDELLQPASYQLSLVSMIQDAQTLSALPLIQLGLATLILTQLLRIFLLCWFYTVIHDYKFSAISIFILCILLYSTFWPH